MFVVAIQIFEGVEESFLRLVFTLKELDVVDQKDVYLAVLVLKFVSLVVCNRIDVVVSELFAGNVANLEIWVKVQCFVTNRMK